jgi:hypothetical protein
MRPHWAQNWAQNWAKSLVIAGLAALPLAGCAGEAGPSPAYLGATTAEAYEADTEPSEVSVLPGPNPSVRHVTSNKVLGAMAFQKVTGRAVDPDRLAGGR